MAIERQGWRHLRWAALGAALALATGATTGPAPAPPAPAAHPPAAATRAPAPAAPGQAQPSTQGSLDHFIQGVGPLCLKAPARECVDKGFTYADRNHDGRLSLEEARSVEAEVNAWTQSNAAKLAPQDRQRVVVGLLVVQSVGLDELFRSYDANGDGFLTKDELLADVRLDQRPLPQVLSDPNSVDWGRLMGRAGAAGPLLRRLFPM